MAMTKCKECKNDVSTKAKECPHCGAKVPKSVGLVGVVFIAIFGWFVYTVASVDTSRSKPSSTVSSSTTITNPVQSSSTNKVNSKPRVDWSTHESTDEMTGKTQAFASSRQVSPTRRMDFPYSDVVAWMGVGCDGASEWAYFGFNSKPNISKDETEDGYNVINTRVKWDDAIENTRLTQEWGAKFIHFTKDRAAIAKISGASNVMLELNWHGQGRVNFIFSLKGSSAAISKMRSICKK